MTYLVQEETLSIEQPHQTALHCTFTFNELLCVMSNGQDTGQRARFVGLEIDLWQNYTGRAHVSIVGGACVFMPLRDLARVRH